MVVAPTGLVARTSIIRLVLLPPRDFTLHPLSARARFLECGQTLEFKRSLNDPTWTQLRVTQGDGGDASVTETLGQLRSGFYRLRVD